MKKVPPLFKKNMKELYPGLDYFDKICYAGSECLASQKHKKPAELQVKLSSGGHRGQMLEEAEGC